jgi:hypothetical protein
MKSTGHSTMALTQVVEPYLENPSNQASRASLMAYRSRMQSALDTLDAAEMPANWRPTTRTILQNNVNFMDECLKSGVITVAALQAFAATQSPELKKVIAWAAGTQVAHWMDVIGERKKMLGDDWNKAYGASNSIYVTRQNNILFSVLAQYFGPQAINNRLLLIETISFTTTPNDVLESLTRIIADRSVGAIFFGDYHLMDYQLMGGDARIAIIAEMTKRGIGLATGRNRSGPSDIDFGSHGLDQCMDKVQEALSSGRSRTSLGRRDAVAAGRQLPSRGRLHRDGQWVFTSHLQLAAGVLGCRAGQITIVNADTDGVPYDTGTSASTGTVVLEQALALHRGRIAGNHPGLC